MSKTTFVPDILYIKCHSCGALALFINELPPGWSVETLVNNPNYYKHFCDSCTIIKDIIE